MRFLSVPASAVAALCGTSAALAQPPLPFPATLELADVEPAGGSIGFVVNGFLGSDESGSAVSSAGDLNGDGIDDLVIGAPNATNGVAFEAGAAFVVFGRDQAAPNAFPGAVELSALNGVTGFALNGIDAEEECGFAVAPAGDLNGDGLDDLVIGAPSAEVGGASNVGRAYVVFGRDTATQGPFPATIDLSSLNGNNGFSLNGINPFDSAGHAVAGIGDVNNDGIDDIAIGANNASGGGRTLAGQAYVLFGRDTAAVGNFPATVSLGALAGTFGFAINGRSTSDNAGWAVAPAGDFNNDGIADLAVGAIDAETDTQAFGTGQTYIIFGKDTANDGPFPAEFEPATLDGTNGLIINGKLAGDNAGAALAAAGDVNNDGIDDLLIGAPGADPATVGTAGESYVVFGRDTTASGNFPATLELASLDGLTGFAMPGTAFGDESGTAVAGIGDINSDGVDDILIGASEADPNGSRSGTSHVVFGRDVAATGLFPAALPLGGLDGTDGFTLNGIGTGDRSGGAVAAAGDVNADGVPDLIIGARGGDPNGAGTGESYVVFGRAPAPACPADTNGDGIVSPADFNAWILAFNTQAAACDQNGDGLCTPADFNAWILNFNNGC